MAGQSSLTSEVMVWDSESGFVGAMIGTYLVAADL